MKKNKIEILWCVLTSVFILCCSICIVWALIALNNSKKYYTLDFTVDETADKEISYKYVISYGDLEITQNFSGSVIKTTEELSLDNGIELSVDKYAVVKLGEVIGKKDGQDVYSTFNGIILEIDNEVSPIITYQNFDKCYCVFTIDAEFKDYFSKGKKYSLFVSKYMREVEIADMVEKEGSFIITTDYFNYSDYSKKSSGIIKIPLWKKSNILRIENEYLKNRLCDNKYELKIYNPTLKENDMYEVIIETGVRGERFTEIISDNVFPYEAVLV